MGIKDDFEYTIKEISEELDISKEKCRQTLLMAVKKLSNSKYRKKIEDIIDTVNEIEKEKN